MSTKEGVCWGGRGPASVSACSQAAERKPSPWEVCVLVGGGGEGALRKVPP
jgi:hypothetical protein